MDFDLARGIPTLARAPQVLTALLVDLPEVWTAANDGADTWSAYDVVGHLIHGERTDWIPRARRILDKGRSVPFDTFDRTAQFAESRGKSLHDLLTEFAELRAGNVRDLEALRLTASDMRREGMHPQLGVVTMGQLLTTWVAHDLNHVGQVAEVMSRQYREAVGPWRAYLDILGRTKVAAQHLIRTDSAGCLLPRCPLPAFWS